MQKICVMLENSGVKLGWPGAKLTSEMIRTKITWNKLYGITVILR